MLAANVSEHEEILAAIASQDADGARERMFQHVCRSGSLVTLRVEQRTAAAATNAG